MRLDLPADFVDKVHSLIDRDLANSDFDEAMYFYSDRTGMLVKYLVKTLRYLGTLGFKSPPQGGTGRMTIMHEGGTTVIKIPIHEPDINDLHSTTRELRLLAALPPDLRFLFPETIHAGRGILVQEACLPSHSKLQGVYEKAQTLVQALHISDFHGDNIGWRGNQPVIIDFETYWDEALRLTSSDAREVHRLNASILSHSNLSTNRKSNPRIL